MKTAAATLQALAPKGIDTLRSEARAQDGAREGGRGGVGAALPAVAEPALAEALPTVSEAEAAQEAARRALEAINASLGQARVATGNAQATFDGAPREHRDAQVSALVQIRAYSPVRRRFLPWTLGRVGLES